MLVRKNIDIYQSLLFLDFFVVFVASQSIRIYIHSQVVRSSAHNHLQKKRPIQARVFHSNFDGNNADMDRIRSQGFDQLEGDDR